MKGYQKTTIIGNLTSAPEKLGETSCKFSVAVNESYKNRDGEVVETTEFFNCVANKGLADVALKHLEKGSAVHLELKQFTRLKDDKKYTNHQVLNLVMLGSGKNKDTGNSNEDEGQNLPF